MGDQYRLVGVADAELLAGLSGAVRRGNEATAEVVAHLVQIEERMLHLDLGFPSLFAYCVQAQGMSEGAAGRRVAAARVCRRFPELFALLARGQLHLSAVCGLAPHLDSANARELFGACAGKSRRDVDELLAARFPKPDVREQIRRLPARAQSVGAQSVGAQSVEMRSAEMRSAEMRSAEMRSAEMRSAEMRSAEMRSAEMRSAEMQSAEAQRAEMRSAETQLVEMKSAGGEARARNREIEPLSAGRYGVRFTADSELRSLIERARGIASHRLPKGDLEGLFKLALSEFVQREEARRFAVGRKLSKVSRGDALRSAAVSGRGEGESESASESGTTPPGGVARMAATKSARAAKRSRHIAAAVRREVYVRDGGACSFVAADGRRCEARAFVEIDHVDPFGVGGTSMADNLRLRCRAHNQQHARRFFGSRYVRAAIDAARRDGASPKQKPRKAEGAA